ncbi:ADP-ribosylglycohydrolase family protein [Adhaeretor mobilis]|uniref:ADP-ribosylglycohydrolase n=1 Tax=Adhaeretor mobilis TaxID=1930276 RepID=A0A517MWH2_9BACT|nr:ADP-ribosylglycohydrolase family protein [Adhaeretor mobilis]QDS99219.1 ADP-ribosylglycohydrolase [Adhaeretor mobilis]
MNRYPHILGCLLGTALGDAVGLRREGLSRRRAERMYGGTPLGPDFILGLGFCSDDAEHTQMVGRALVLSAGHVAKFEKELSRQLKRWLVALPAGIGLATLRACIKLLLGFGPKRSGVFSAGNGPAMRTALIGVWAESDDQLKELVRICTRLTHTDPRAEEGALLVAKAARLTASGQYVEPTEFLRDAVGEVEGEELRESLQMAIKALAANKAPKEFADSLGWSEGVTGYVNHSVPAALYCWADSPNDFRRCVENAVLLGGDTDSVAAIAGAICGANVGSENLPPDWLISLAEWPRSKSWMRQLAEALSNEAKVCELPKPPGMRWLATVPRNFVFAAIVLVIGFRRLLPPY